MELRLGLVFSTVVAVAIAVSRPPDMIVMSGKEIYYKVGESIEMLCLSSGEPRPIYSWEKNEKEFDPAGNDDRIVQLANQGTIVFNRPDDRDEGMFQCFARNNYGIAASVKYNMRMAVLNDFPIGAETVYRVPRGVGRTLNCVPPTSLPPAEVYWVTTIGQTGDYRVVRYDQRITMDHEGRLHITNVQPQDALSGNAFACSAMNIVMRSNVRAAGYRIIPTGTTDTKIQPSIMWTSPTDYQILKGEDYKMKCIFAGNPSPDVTWSRANGPMPGSAIRNSFGQELMIRNIQPEDAGQYECSGNNNVAQQPVTRSFRVSVNSRPTWVNIPQDVEAAVGGTATFLCSAVGNPTPSVQWYINGKPVTETVNPNRIIKGGNATFVNLGKNDAQVLQCNASNLNGYVWKNAYLNVLEQRPEFVMMPQALLTVAESQSVNLTCRTTGKPDPVFTWFKNNDIVSGGRYRTMLNGDLEINSVVLADAGEYRCEARNKFGEVAASGAMAVRRQTRIEQFPMDLQVTEGKDAKFTCSGTTDPEEVQNLRTIWLKDERPIMTNDQRMTLNIQDSSLTISGTISRDSGIYTCIIANGLDNATASAVLRVRGKPDAPTSIKVRCMQLNADVEWIVGSSNSAPIQYFIVEYRTHFNPDQWNFGVQVPYSQSIARVKMSPWATFSFRVYARNKIGQSEPSVASVELCSPGQNQPDINPQNVRTIGDKEKFLIIEWTVMPEIQHNGPGFVYVLTTKQVGRPDEELETYTINDWRIIRKEILVNNIYEPYEIKLQAKNGPGFAREPVVMKIGYSGEAIPNIIPTNLLQDPSVLVEADTAGFVWDAIDDSRENVRKSIRGNFRGYKIQYWKASDKTNSFREQFVPKTSINEMGQAHTIVTDLIPDANMQFHVIIVNNYYASAPSNVINVKTPQGLPGPTETFKSRVRGANHFVLEWSTPTDTNGQILGYDIGYQTVVGLDLGKMQYRNPQINNRFEQRTVLSGLEPVMTYRVHIWARTIVGRGEDRFIEVATTKAGDPTAPRFYFSIIGDDFFNVTWEFNPEQDHVGSVYYVEYRKYGATEWQQSTDETVNEFKHISGLESGTSYEVRVVATTGTSRTHSEIQIVRTGGVDYAVGFIGGATWFIGLLLSLIIIIFLFVLIYWLFKRYKDRPIFKSHSHSNYPNGTSTTRLPTNAQGYNEPRGISNEYGPHEDDSSIRKSRGSLDYSIEKHPPSENGSYYSGYDDQYRDSYPPRYEDAQREGAQREGAASTPRSRYSYTNDDYDDDYDQEYTPPRTPLGRGDYDGDHGQPVSRPVYDHPPQREQDGIALSPEPQGSSAMSTFV